MCEDGKSESTAGATAGVSSSRAHAPSTSGRSSRMPSPDAVLQDPDFSPGRRVTRSFLAESLIDMRIPPGATPSPRLGRKRHIEEVVGDSTRPPPDKLLRELDRQHEEAKEVRRTSATVPQQDSAQQSQGTEGHEIKRQRRLVIRGSNPMRDREAASAHRAEDNGNDKKHTSRPSSKESASGSHRPKG